MKKILCAMLCGVMVLASFGTLSAVAASQPMKIYTTLSTVQAGKEMSVAIRVENNPGIISLKVQLSYDSSVFTMVNAVKGNFDGVSFGPVGNNPFTVNWVNGLQGNNTTNDIVALITFRVAETVPENAKPAFTVTANPADVFNYDLQAVPFVCQGSEDFSILPMEREDEQPDTRALGDVNGDGKIDAKDALETLRMAVLKRPLNAADKIVADVNKDNRVDAKDALEMLKYVVGKPSLIPILIS